MGLFEDEIVVLVMKENQEIGLCETKIVYLKNSLTFPILLHKEIWKCEK